MYCSNCGTKLREGTSFCPNCGMSCSSNFQNIHHPKTNQINIDASVIIGIIACIFFFMPFISIPLAIISIVLGSKQKSETKHNTGRVLGIISLCLSIIEIILFILAIIFFANLDIKTIESTMNDEIIEHFYDREYDTKSFDIKGYSWIGDDKSILYLNKDNTYHWYQSDNNHEDNFYSGIYEVYTGTTAIDYIAEELEQYGITKEEQYQLFQNQDHQLKDYYLIILENTKTIINKEEQPNTNNTIYYYGLFNDKTKYLDLVNIATNKDAGFTLKERLSSIDL